MADVTIPTIGAGTSNGTAVEQNFYNPTATGTTSAEIINGHLDDANRSSAWKINRTHIQRGALTQGKTEGGTLNLDYFGELFPGWNLTDDMGSVADKAKMNPLYQVIPGASVEFYLPATPSFVLFSWQTFVSAEQKDLADGGAGHAANHLPARIRLFVNGGRIARKILTVPTRGFHANDARGGWDRHWAGHYLATGLSEGWNSASLRIAVDPGSHAGGTRYFPDASSNTICRVRVRSMNYVVFK
tara:strand:+ start:1173 stop:1904 length:732 start_codon:yes stop_codon:yes gene_type:complete